jgi:hypothetical protein
MQLTPKTASVVPPEDGRLTSGTCRGFKTLQTDREGESVLSWLRYCDIPEIFQFLWNPDCYH